MGPENDILSNGMLYCAVEGTDDYKPIGIVSHVDLGKVSTENDISEEFIERRIIPNEMTVTLTIKAKHHKKTFKKWLMAHGYSRDVANGICHLVGLLKGHVSYETMYLYILTGGNFV